MSKQFKVGPKYDEDPRPGMCRFHFDDKYQPGNGHWCHKGTLHGSDFCKAHTNGREYGT